MIIYYAIWDGEDYLETAKNSTSLAEVKEDLLSIFEVEYSEADIETLKTYNSAHQIAAIRGWTIDHDTKKF